MELIKPTKQKVWGWPGVVNFILAGISTGFYLLNSLAAILQCDSVGQANPAGFKLLAPALTSLGFLSLTIEAGHPLRGRYLFRHLRHSWMSRETLAAAVFIPVAVIDSFFPHPALWALAAAAATGLVVSQGFIVYRVRAVTAWNVPLVPVLFLTSALATGGGLMLLVALGQSNVGTGPVLLGLICVFLDLVVWLLYLHSYRDLDFFEATEALRGRTSLIFTVGMGHVLPILLLALLIIVGVNGGVELWHTVAALAGLVMMLGGMSQKAGIVLEAGYQKGIALGRRQDSVGDKATDRPLSLPAHQSDLSRPSI